MATPKFFDRVKETTATTGTGTYSLSESADGVNRTFASAYASGDEVLYCVEDSTDWEVGIGTYTAASPDTLSRDTVLASSNANSAVDWASGDKKVFATAPADFLKHMSFEFSSALGGSAASATGSEALAIGVSSTAAGSTGIAIGKSADASGSSGISIGWGSEASAGSAIGIRGTASASDTIAMGRAALASGTNAVSIGQASDANNIDSVAIGVSAQATATNAVALGDSAAASGSDSVAVGVDSIANASNAAAYGNGARATAVGATALGYQANGNGSATGSYALNAARLGEANGDYSQVFGRNLVNDLPGTAAFGIDSDAGHYMAIAEADTTDGSATEMTLYGASGLTVKASSTWAVKGIISARQTAGTSGSVGDSAMFEIDALITRDGAGNTTLIGETSAAATHNTAAFGGSVSIAADDTNNTLDISVTGEADKTIHWVGKIEIVEAG